MEDLDFCQIFSNLSNFLFDSISLGMNYLKELWRFIEVYWSKFVHVHLKCRVVMYIMKMIIEMFSNLCIVGEI